MPTGKTKTYHVGARVYELRPMSYFELLDLPDFVLEVVDVLPKDGEAVNPLQVLKSVKGSLKEYLAERIGATAEDLKEIPHEIGMEMAADFVEMTLTENFLKALIRAVAAVKSVHSRWPRS